MSQHRVDSSKTLFHEWLPPITSNMFIDISVKKKYFIGRFKGPPLFKSQETGFSVKDQKRDHLF
jgi:hypothetical protein